MTPTGPNDEINAQEVGEIASYLMRFAIAAHAFMILEQTDELVDFVADSAMEVYAYRHDERLPSAPKEPSSTENHGWRLV